MPSSLPAAPARSAGGPATTSGPARRRRPLGPSAASRPATASASSAARPADVGVGDDRAADAVGERRERVVGQPRRDPVQVCLVAGQRGDRVRELPARGPRRRSRRPSALAGGSRRSSSASSRRRRCRTPGELGLRLGVALDRVGRELVDVGEDRLGQRVQHLGLEARRCGRRRRGGARRPARRPGRRTAASRGSGPGAARRGRGRRRRRGPARARRRGRGPGRRTGSAPRRRRPARRGRTSPRAAARTRAPRGRSRRGCRAWWRGISGSITSATLGGSSRQGSVWRIFVTQVTINVA